MFVEKKRHFHRRITTEPLLRAVHDGSERTDMARAREINKR